MASPLQTDLTEGGIMPLEKQNGWDEFKANLAASWAAELLFLRTHQKVQDEKKEDKLRILLLRVSRI